MKDEETITSYFVFKIINIGNSLQGAPAKLTTTWMEDSRYFKLCKWHNFSADSF